MSESEGDFEDELLELAGAGEKKRRKRQAQHKSSKRQKPDMSGSDSESASVGPESEEEETNPYPLDGKFTDEEDRERLLGMSEIEREDILAQRQEEMQRIQDKRNLDQMLRERTGRGEESVSKAAKRHHAQRGATKEKSRKLDELKAKRKAKDTKKSTRTDSPKRDRSSSPMDMGSSDEEEEDGQISKFEEEEEHDRKHFGKASNDDEPITIEDLDKVRVTRDMVIKHCFSSWFSDYIKGAWVRYLVGQNGNTPVYRACEVLEVSTDVQHPYKVNNQMVDYELKLKHGASEKFFQVDKISNAPFTDREFDRLARVGEIEKTKLPTKSALRKKAAQMTKYVEQPLTESDISLIVARKNQVNAKVSLHGGPVGNTFWMEKLRLQNARSFAISRKDAAEVEKIDAQLNQLLANAEHNGSYSKTRKDEAVTAIIERVNERNRKANLEQVRKAEQAESERKRRERKLAASANGTATPPVRRYKGMLDSRPGTPGTPGTPLKTALATPRSLSPLPPSETKDSTTADPDASFEASVLDSVEIDLGDF